MWVTKCSWRSLLGRELFAFRIEGSWVLAILAHSLSLKGLDKLLTVCSCLQVWRRFMMYFMFPCWRSICRILRIYLSHLQCNFEKIWTLSFNQFRFLTNRIKCFAGRLYLWWRCYGEVIAWRKKRGSQKQLCGNSIPYCSMMQVSEFWGQNSLKAGLNVISWFSCQRFRLSHFLGSRRAFLSFSLCNGIRVNWLKEWG